MKEKSIIKTEKNSSKSDISKIHTLEKLDVNIPEKLSPFTVVAIGASAGGLEAVTRLLQNLSPTTGMAFIYVQHLSPDHKSLLTPILSRITAMSKLVMT